MSTAKNPVLNPEAVFTSMQKYGMLGGEKNVVAAVSGGCDSVTMLDILLKLRESCGFCVSVCHVNHNLRGEESLRDENFVRALCKDRGIKLFVLGADVKGYALEHGLSTEEAGRQLRYDFFEECAAKLGENTLIATAHSLSDRTETFLFNAARGTGISGLCSIPPKRGKIIRPLIDFTREQIEAYREANSLSFVTDSSNLADNYSRNKIRHGAVPVLKEINPSFERNMAFLFSDLAEARELIDSESSALLEKAKTEGGFSAVKIKAAPEALKKAAAAKLLLRFGFSAERERINFLCEKLGEDFKAELSAGEYLVSRGGIISKEKKKVFSAQIEPIPFLEGIFRLSEEKSVKIDVISKENYICSYKVNGYFSKAVFDYDKIRGITVIRSRLEGDKGSFHGGTKTLKKLFNEEKIPPEKRNSAAVIADEGGVLWVEGIGAEKRCRLTEETKNVAAIRIILD